MECQQSVNNMKLYEIFIEDYNTSYYIVAENAKEAINLFLNTNYTTEDRKEGEDKEKSIYLVELNKGQIGVIDWDSDDNDPFEKVSKKVKI